MDISAIVQLPNELKDAHWQKAKGLLGKTKSTGVGAELKKLETMHKKIDSTKLDPASSPIKDRDDIPKRKQAAMAYYKSAVQPVMVQLKTVAKVAGDAEKKLKKVPGKADKAAGNIVKAANTFAVTCKSLDLNSRVEKLEADMDNMDALARKELMPSIKKYAAGVKSYMASDQTAQDWTKLIKQNGRSISNSVKQLPVYREQFWKEFVKFQGFDESSLKITGDEEADKKRRLAILKMVQPQVKAIADYKP